MRLSLLFAFVVLLTLTPIMVACPPSPQPPAPFDASDGAVADVQTPWNDAHPDAEPSDPGFVIEPTCGAAARVLHDLGCPEGSDERKFAIVCTQSRGEVYDFREACVAKAVTQAGVRTCCGSGEVCSRIRCAPTSGAKKER